MISGDENNFTTSSNILERDTSYSVMVVWVFIVAIYASFLLSAANNDRAHMTMAYRHMSEGMESVSPGIKINSSKPNYGF